MASDPSAVGWKLLRVVPNDGGAGTFTDDTDWVAGAELPPASETTSVMRYRADSGANAVTAVEVIVSAFDDAGVWLARAGTFTLTPVQEIQMPEAAEKLYPAGSKATAADGEATASAVLDRPYTVRLHGECKAFTVRLSSFASMPATADHLKVFWRDVGG